jgi:hypothetical protein
MNYDEWLYYGTLGAASDEDVADFREQEVCMLYFVP